MMIEPRWRRTLFVLVLLVAVPLAALRFMDILVRQMLYPAPAVPVASPAPEPLAELAMETSEGDTVVGWLSQRADGPTVLFLHGNGENLETVRWSGLFDDFHRLGASVLAIDYPGYGRSTGKPGERALVASGLAGLRALDERFPDRPIFLVGWSLGAAVAIRTAVPHQERLSGLALLSPWHDLPSVASRIFPEFLVRFALRDRYLSGEAAADLTLPALVVHGENDDLIPVEQGRRLAERLPAGSRFVGLAGVGHNDLMAQRETWRLLAEAMGLPATGM